MKKRLFYAAVAALLLLSLVSCGRDGLPPDESSGGPVPNSSAEVTWEAPDETLSASLAKLLSKHSSNGLVSSYRQGGCVPAGWCSAGGDHIKRRIYKIMLLHL